MTEGRQKAGHGACVWDAGGNAGGTGVDEPTGDTCRQTLRSYHTLIDTAFIVPASSASDWESNRGEWGGWIWKLQRNPIWPHQGLRGHRLTPRVRFDTQWDQKQDTGNGVCVFFERSQKAAWGEVPKDTSALWLTDISSTSWAAAPPGHQSPYEWH